MFANENMVERIGRKISKRWPTLSSHVVVRDVVRFVIGELEPEDIPKSFFVPGPKQDTVIPMILHCPECLQRHVDQYEFVTKPHHTHACQGCGFVWRPAVVPTVGVQYLPGFKDK